MLTRRPTSVREHVHRLTCLFVQNRTSKAKKKRKRSVYSLFVLSCRFKVRSNTIVPSLLLSLASWASPALAQPFFRIFFSTLSCEVSLTIAQRPPPTATDVLVVCFFFFLWLFQKGISTNYPPLLFFFIFVLSRSV